MVFCVQLIVKYLFIQFVYLALENKEYVFVPVKTFCNM